MATAVGSGSGSGGGGAGDGRARTWARLAVLCVLGALAFIAAAAGSGGVLLLVIGLLGSALTGAGVWWALAHRRAARLLGVVLAVVTPIAVLVLFAATGVWLLAVAVIVLWAAALGFARACLRRLRQPYGMHARGTPPPRRPVLIMNPRSGGGKVERFGLVERAEALGARVVLLEPDGPDVETLARQAVAEGADLLGAAGGDGTLAIVASVAVEHRLPFLVVSAGTRNHFAMDLGLDRNDPSTCLDALTEGVELRVDLGDVDGRPFVNTVSFGAYAHIVQNPDYRDAKTATALEHLPDLLQGSEGAHLEADADGTEVSGPQALLISNNPYARADPFGGGRRPRLDRGSLGVIAVRVEGAAGAAEVALLGERAGGITVLTATRVVVRADTDTVPVAVDGEALTMPVPVVCTVRPKALRIRVPRHRPGAAYVTPPVDWRRIVHLALTFRTAPQGAE
ncbi:diacylglycerol/lipid kinase family protein [Streptomyces sp. NPDC058739]|uniref:diacylglycerol/lipid kinase family protein n=1 Tax=Streptomyces sp. NPDC058739 TaxID=3346618 RepID=UPI0036741E2E